MEVPDDIAASLVDAVGAYLRAQPSAELPGPLRRYRKFRPRTLQRFREELLAVLDDEVERARIIEWLDAAPPLKKDASEMLRIAAERPEGYEAALSARSRVVEELPVADLELQLRQEREKVRAAREWARRARAEARAEVDRERKRTEKALRSFEAENARRKELEAGLEKARGELDRTKAETQRSLKQARRSAERAAAARDEARAEAKAAHRQVTRLERTVEELRGGPAPAPRENETDAERARGDSARRRRKSDRQPAPGDSPSARPPRVRSPLPVPKGMFDTDPMTLNAWLASPNVTVLVDGYNVTKHERGFGDLTLEAQRERLREELDRLARRYGASATIVFDGAQLPPGTSRRRRGKRVRVEYSEPPESGDDRLVAVLGAQPNFPVIVVTGDRGLQERVRELGATVASAGQLLGLIR